MRPMQTSQGRAEVAATQPSVSPLWRPADSELRRAANLRRRFGLKAKSSAGRLGEPWAQQGGIASTGETAPGESDGTHWAGEAYGVRPPEPKEIALSWAEVQFAKKRGLL
jgi:hypothetical protein